MRITDILNDRQHVVQKAERKSFPNQHRSTRFYGMIRVTESESEFWQIKCKLRLMMTLKKGKERKREYGTIQGSCNTPRGLPVETRGRLLTQSGSTRSNTVKKQRKMSCPWSTGVNNFSECSAQSCVPLSRGLRQLILCWVIVSSAKCLKLPFTPTPLSRRLSCDPTPYESDDGSLLQSTSRIPVHK